MLFSIYTLYQLISNLGYGGGYDYSQPPPNPSYSGYAGQGGGLGGGYQQGGYGQDQSSGGGWGQQGGGGGRGGGYGGSQGKNVASFSIKVITISFMEKCSVNFNTTCVDSSYDIGIEVNFLIAYLSTFYVENNDCE